jgi:hypothetical protein
LIVRDTRWLLTRTVMAVVMGVLMGLGFRGPDEVVLSQSRVRLVCHTGTTFWPGRCLPLRYGFPKLIES